MRRLLGVMMLVTVLGGFEIAAHASSGQGGHPSRSTPRPQLAATPEPAPGALPQAPGQPQDLTEPSLIPGQPAAPATPLENGSSDDYLGDLGSSSPLPGDSTFGSPSGSGGYQFSGPGGTTFCNDTGSGGVSCSGPGGTTFGSPQP